MKITLYTPELTQAVTEYMKGEGIELNTQTTFDFQEDSCEINIIKVDAPPPYKPKPKPKRKRKPKVVEPQQEDPVIEDAPESTLTDTSDPTDTLFG